MARRVRGGPSRCCSHVVKERVLPSSSLADGLLAVSGSGRCCGSGRVQLPTGECRQKSAAALQRSEVKSIAATFQLWSLAFSCWAPPVPAHLQLLECHLVPRGCRVLPVAMDDEGVLPESLEQVGCKTSACVCGTAPLQEELPGAAVRMDGCWDAGLLKSAPLSCCRLWLAPSSAVSPCPNSSTRCRRGTTPRAS